MPCSEPHTAETYAVGDLPATLEDVDYDDPALGTFAYQTCAAGVHDPPRGRREPGDAHRHELGVVPSVRGRLGRGRPLVPLRRRRRWRAERVVRRPAAEHRQGPAPRQARRPVAGVRERPDRHRLGEDPLHRAAHVARGHHDQAGRARRRLPRRPASSRSAPATSAPTRSVPGSTTRSTTTTATPGSTRPSGRPATGARSAGRRRTSEPDPRPPGSGRPGSWPAVCATAILLAGCTSSGTPTTSPETLGLARLPRGDARPHRWRPRRPGRPRAPATGSTYDQALAPTTHARPVPCRAAHTATTYLVGTLDTVVDGSSPRRRLRRACRTRSRPPARAGFGRFVGGHAAPSCGSACCAPSGSPRPSTSPTAARTGSAATSSPSPADEELAPLTGPVEGVLAHASGPDPLRDLRHRRARHARLRAGHLQPEALLAGDRDVRRPGQVATPARRPCAPSRQRPASPPPRSWPPTPWTTSGATSGRPGSSGTPGSATACAGPPAEVPRLRSRACAAAAGRAASPWRS